MNKIPTATADELVALLKNPIVFLSKDVIRNLSVDNMVEAFETAYKAVLYRGVYVFVYEGFEYKATRAAVETAAVSALLSALEKRA